MKRKPIVIAGTVIIILLAVFLWWRYYFVFGEGVKAGNLNFFVKKGYIFKTWEGRLIQEGFRTQTPGAIQSNEFEFSVRNDSIASVLERCGGRFVELRYKEYLNPLPWRGMSNYVVTEIVGADNIDKQSPGAIPLE
ncbi:MAG: hypothetical protein IPN08_04205 [Bacteroidales bacterium]|nr:hypothetical protein [Bacteroidales bacterium]MBK9356586.1 hypothetical protein [Bacteroidales bacterium]